MGSRSSMRHWFGTENHKWSEKNTNKEGKGYAVREVFSEQNPRERTSHVSGWDLYCPEGLKKRGDLREITTMAVLEINHGKEFYLS